MRLPSPNYYKFFNKFRSKAIQILKIYGKFLRHMLKNLTKNKNHPQNCKYFFIINYSKENLLERERERENNKASFVWNARVMPKDPFVVQKNCCFIAESSSATTSNLGPLTFCHKTYFLRLYCRKVIYFCDYANKSNIAKGLVAELTPPHA